MCEGKCKNDDVNEIIQNSILDINRDIINDYKNINKRKDIIISLLIVSLVATFFYYSYRLSEFDYEDVDRIITTTDNNSQIDNSKDVNAQNNIHIVLPKKDKK